MPNNTGWQCPVCNAVNSPQLEQCLCRGNVSFFPYLASVEDMATNNNNCPLCGFDCRKDLVGKIPRGDMGNPCQSMPEAYELFDGSGRDIWVVFPSQKKEAEGIVGG